MNDARLFIEQRPFEKLCYVNFRVSIIILTSRSKSLSDRLMVVDFLEFLRNEISRSYFTW